jgi:hypothetical protein
MPNENTTGATKKDLLELHNKLFLTLFKLLDDPATATPALLNVARQFLRDNSISIGNDNADIPAIDCFDNLPNFDDDDE